MNIQDWFPLRLIGWISLQSKGLSSLLQHHSSKASILQRSAFFIVQLSQPYMTTGKTIALTRQTLVTKVMSLLFNMLSRLVMVFLPRNKRLLISWLQDDLNYLCSSKFSSLFIIQFKYYFSMNYFLTAFPNTIHFSAETSIIIWAISLYFLPTRL